ncbi:hypothetical protein [Enterobacter hormaechei]|uniref:hypothetical protein n=1 Tax=Enterobacter hormaechei TaxID=158836 RepID=UPI0030165C5C
MGASDCPVYLSLKNDPPTLRNDSAQYVPYSSAYRSETVPNKTQNKVPADEIVVEQDGYAVHFSRSNNCSDSRLTVKNISTGKTAAITGVNGCTFNPKKNAVVIYPVNEYVSVYSGTTNTSEEIATADLP